MRTAVTRARVARLATVRADGRPHLVPVCFVLLGDVVYHAVDHKPKRGPRLTRIANIEANPVASLLVDAYNEDWSALWWVRLDGRARLVHDHAEAEHAIAALAAKYPQYADRPPDGPVLAVTVDSWTGWSATPVDIDPSTTTEH
jgi:PPOX class probable F420-dependent enzyme